MSKKQHDYYYSFTSPPSASSSSSAPSAPSIDEVQDNNDMASPPGYDEAIQVLDSTLPFSTPHPPAKKSELDGYVRDRTIPSFNPASPSSSTATAPPQGIVLDSQPHTNSPSSPLHLQNTDINNDYIYNTGDYGDNEPLLSIDQQQQLTPPQQNPFQGRPPPPNYTIYHAQYETKKSGLLSRDHHLNNDGEALAQFLQQHNVPPNMKIKFYGYHEETYYRSRNTRDEEGNWREEREPVTKRVDDFNFDIDCSATVDSTCRGLYVLPDPKTGHIKTVRELCDDYVHEVNQLKELRLTKVIDWDYAQLTRAFTSAIRAHGYYHSVVISYELGNHKITIKTDSTVSRLSDNKAIRFLFFITCLWIFAWPILWLCKKKFGHSILKSEWAMKVTERQWYEDHVHEVLGQIDRTPRFGNVPFLL
ncbi:hypothetical protein BCR42DRAFT_403196 [Absidia repens]|uniref:Uncharacterized protein n=1 Tax=Absidia repens TaxID=90262 RepID=A0A1X2IZ40_9FUNG|nr:hypothetical protein BCR42DRAFT_403196 [Absidia repens]